ncbi:hypothetical protein EV175_002959 [Coemansia sp. RSA 1933]|nr:hypothetical protein EV175_002959 [Coemansia sp. RSA 1933]
MASPTPADAHPTAKWQAADAQAAQRSAADAHPAQWSSADVYRWALAQSAVAPVAPVLRDHAVDGHVLLNYVTNTVLAEELGVAAFGTRVHILEAIETLRWNAGMCPRPRYASPAARSLSPASARRSPSDARSRSPDSDHRSSKDASPDPAHPHSKRSASRVADAEKKRQKRAELKKNPALYAEYLQKERERNARRRARLRAERGRSSSGSNNVGSGADPGALAAPAGSSSDPSALAGPAPAVALRPDAAADAYHSSPNSFTHATAAAAKPAYTVNIHNPLLPPPHNIRHSADPANEPHSPGPAAVPPRASSRSPGPAAPPYYARQDRSQDRPAAAHAA